MSDVNTKVTDVGGARPGSIYLMRMSIPMSVMYEGQSLRAFVS